MYFDTSYLVRLYFDDPGFAAVRRLAGTGQVASSILGQAEMLSALHRKLRERSITSAQYKTICAQFADDSEAGAFTWLPVSPAVMERVRSLYTNLPPSVYLRAGDAIHLASALENGFREIYSNDQHLLLAAEAVGLRPSNII